MRLCKQVFPYLWRYAFAVLHIFPPNSRYSTRVRILLCLRAPRSPPYFFHRASVRTIDYRVISPIMSYSLPRYPRHRPLPRLIFTIVFVREWACTKSTGFRDGTVTWILAWRKIVTVSFQSSYRRSSTRRSGQWRCIFKTRDYIAFSKAYLFSKTLFYIFQGWYFQARGCLSR